MQDRPEGAEGHLDGKRAHLARLLAAEARQLQTHPLSFAQQRLWFLDQIAPGTAAYNVVQAFRLGGEVHLEALRRSLATIVERQASLRTTFTAVEGHALQVVRPDGGDRLAVLDLEAFEPAERERCARRLVAEEAECPFDLQQGPLFRATLVRLGELDHVLLLVMHHIVSDGWSMGVLLGELGQLYTAHRAGLGSPLRPLRIQYADFATWQREQLQDERLRVQLDYWREQLKGAAPLELPTDRPRPAVQSFRGRRLPFALGRDLREALRSFAKREGLTLFMTLLAAFQALLQRYSGQGDIVVGSPIASRTRTELEGLVGFFVNTLVLRTDLSGDPTFRELAQRVRRVALAAYAQPDVPFERLVDELAADRSLDRNPVFQVVFALQNAPAEPLELPGLRVTPFEIERTTSKLDLTLSLEESGEGLEGFFEYCTDLFDATTIERMAGHYRRLLAGALSRPDARVSELPLLGDDERQRLLVAWNETDREPWRSDLVHGLVAQQAVRLPEREAVVLGAARLPYVELDRRSSQLARYLRKRGVGPEVRVAIALDRSPELFVAVLGVLKAGGAYVALDPEAPAERLAFMASDAAAAAVLTQEHRQGVFRAGGAEVICLDRDWAAISTEPAAACDAGVGLDNLAYVIYTSGSTGLPKGVELTHRGLLNLVWWHRDTYGVGESDRATQVAGLGFDASVWEIWPYLTAGASIHVPDEDTRTDPARMREWLAAEAITLCFLPTPVAEAMLELGPPAGGRLRALLTGGDRLRRHPIQDLGFPLVNHYGPTENTVVATAGVVPVAEGDGRAPSIGRPIWNVRAHVLDARMELVPIGVPGELYVGGEGLARGYLGRPELTAGSFVPDPFARSPGERLYRTGDRARYRADGQIDILGRMDHQVKIRGHRIELGEIESVLKAHPSVRETVVVSRPMPDGQKRLLACLVGEGPADAVPSAELRQFLRSRLPEYMVPHGFVWLDALPLTRNGKVDREALARLDLPRADGDSERFVEPQTPIEAQIAALWAEVLGVERVGVNDNFFELGGDSILSIQLTARASKVGLSIRPRDLFQHQTVAELARVAAAPAGAGAEQGPVTGPVPLTPIQRWFFEQPLPEPRHFAQSVLLEVPSPVEPPLLERALAHLAAHHDALRLRFRGEGAGRHQVSGPAEEAVALRRVDLSAVADDERPAAVEAVAAELTSSLDLGRGPLWRAALVGLGGGSFQLLWVVHHLAVDGVSWRILIEDLDTAYRQLLEGETIRLPSKTTSFQKWAERLERYARTEARGESDYWLGELGGPARSLPVDHPDGRMANDFSSVRKATVTLGEEETEALLREVPQAYGTRTHEVLLAALAQVLGRWTSAPTVLVDVEAHGREEVVDGVDLSRTVGWFTVMHPLRLPLEGVDAAPRRALTLVKEQLRRVPNRGLGYGLLRYLGADPGLSERLASLSRAELSFNYLGQFDQLLGEEGRFRLAGGEDALRFSGRGPRAHVLGVSGRVVGRRLRLEWSYAESLHRRETVESLARSHIEAVRGLIAHCQSPGAGGHTPSDFPLASLDQKTLDHLVGADREIEAIYPLSPTQQGILFHARLAPESVAYYAQFHQKLQGVLDVAAFRSAWAQTAERHAVLRTSFAWLGLDEPLQVVRRRITLPFEEHDWRSLPPDERAARLEAWLRTDRERRIDLSRAPVWRIALFRGPDEAFDYVLSFHHSILDGWSVALLLSEVFARYEAIRGGPAPRLPPARPFQDYIAWLRSRGASGVEDFWRKELSGFSTPTGLRLAPPAGAGTEERYAEGELQLPPDFLVEMQGLARRSHLTLNTLLQGAWALLLGRYSGEDDVVFGATVSGRPAELEGVESAVGLFINTLPVRVPLPPREPVLEWLGRLQARQVELQKHEWSSLADVQRWSEVPEGAPLFESLLLFENYPAVQSLWRRDGALRVVDVRGYQESSYPLTVVVVPRDGLRVRIKYDCRRFTRTAVERMLEHYRRVLEAFRERPEARLAEVSLLGAEERRRVLVEWNDTRTAYPRDQALHRLFEAQAERTPDRLAVVFGEERITYRELNERANRVARHLRRRGVGIETHVGLCVERSASMVVGMLAILKAGGAYVPLDPSYPRERLAYMARDAGVAVVLTQESLRSQVPEEATAFLLDADIPAATDEDRENLVGDASPEALAYVIYTSGSTGEPKGVAVPHRAVSRLVLDTNYVELGPDDVVAQASSSSFDATTFEVWAPLLSGGLLVGITRDVTLSPPAFADELREHGVTVLFLTTALFNHLVREAPGALAGRTVLFGGEAVDPHWVRTALEGAPPRRLLHVYGPTETTTFATWHAVTEVAPDATTVPIGRPISNATSYVLDRALNPVPIGLAGELYLGGDGVARGYLGRPGLTAERFVPDPFGDEPGGRLYRTGDLVRAQPDGSLEFLGRVDHQVKLRGFRIELGEIEARLAQHPAVRDAVVLVREDEPGDRRLVAYLVWSSPAGVAAGELRAYLGTRLPEYMVPAAFVALEALPLNRNGKVDRAALPAPEGRRLELAEDYLAPRTPVEEILAGIYAQVLGLDRVSVEDGFFDLGGHSLRATQVVSRIREALHVDLPLRTLFDSPTVAGLAGHVEEERRRAEGARTPSSPERRPDAGPPPLSFAQQRLWFLDQLEPGSPVYNLPVLLRLTGALDADALARGFAEIQRRHEVLRTTFVSSGGVPVQRVAAAPGAALERTDLSGLDPSAREAEWRRLGEEDVARPFDLAEGPLVRGRLLRLAEAEHVLVVVMHHAVSDGWSMGVFARELEALYGAFRAGRPSPLPELSLQYADFAAWQREWLRGAELESQVSYWRKKLGGNPEGVTFPADRPRPAQQTFRGGRESSRLPRKLSDDLRALSRREGATLFMTLLAALDVLLCRHSGQYDVVVGTPIAGRTRAEVESLVGFFVNTLVLRTDLSGRPSFRDLLGRVRETALGAYAHQDLPFEKLVEHLHPERDLSRTPLFQVMFNLVNLEAHPTRLEGLTVETLPNPAPESKFDLTLYALDGPAEIRLVAVYNADLYEPARIGEILAQIEQVLGEAVAGPEEPIDRLSLVTPGARRRLPDPALPLARATYESVTARLAAQARRVPTRPAVVDSRRAWTYEELHVASSRLAGHLQALGITRGDVVAIHGPRSAALVGALLGVLKAGGAFLILDPAHPALRTIECLRQAQPKAFVQLAAAGPLAAGLEDFVAAMPCRVELSEDPGSSGPWTAALSAPGVDAGGDDRAYVAFTSGSTGSPRGIVGTHAPLSHFLDWHTRRFGLEERDRFSLLSGLSHDPLLRDVFTPLWLGATLVVPDPETIAQGRLGEWMAGERVTVAHLTPALGRLLTEGRRPLPELRYAFFGGDVLTREDLGRLRALAPAARGVSYYGATETPQGMGVFVVPDTEDGDAEDRRPVPLGKGIADVRLLVLGPGGNPAGVGELGEIHVQTPYLADGYLGDESLTRERFVPDPFSGAARGRLYRTGDLGRYGLDGDVEYAGRADDQIKLRGFRIEPAEIEAAIRRHPEVSQAAVVAGVGRLGEKRLVAYVVGRDGRAPATEELRAFLSERLPDYMVPSHFRVLSALPLTPNGKLDRRALPPVAEDGADSERSDVGPRTPVEELLCRVWRELLGVERVGIHDSFFGLGGHSLLATQVVSRLRDELAVELPLRRLFEKPTVAELALDVTQALLEGADPEGLEELIAEVRQLSGERPAPAEAESPAAESQG